MRRVFATTRRRLAVLAGALVLVAIGAGIAAWIIQGQGAGRSGVGTLTAPTITELPVVTPDLVPSDTPTGTFYFQVSNPNAVPLTLTGIQENGTIEKKWVTTPPGPCSLGDFTVPTQNGLTIAIPAAGSTDVALPNTTRLAPSAGEGCQGGVVSIGVTGTFSTG